ncbi:hypothetical protein CYFUS_001600 [Cystobacter fuscus]|uniref:Uncharacterized protein n=1 Tax=Cystobacter fuscus TaxID=43 RepID=A0A250IZ55_9BACT|nr:hypothetical protein [Cystobacter fuscus]ATB36186.1 hypothetical protein CYFUS_001600 [Cystobacter fuscus]
MVELQVRSIDSHALAIFHPNRGQAYPVDDSNGSAIRTGIRSQTANYQCGAVSVSYGVQTIDNISDAQVAACGDAIAAVGGALCHSRHAA